MLHIVNKSPFQTSTFDSCLRFAQAGDALLLIEDGIYAATIGGSAEANLRKACASLQIYALQPDVDARGMSARLIQGVTPVDYGGFVDLAAQHNTSHAWL